jgi:hypothetical protein
LLKKTRRSMSSATTKGKKQRCPIFPKSTRGMKQFKKRISSPGFCLPSLTFGQILTGSEF